MKNKRLIAKIMDGNTVVMTIDQNLSFAEFSALDRGSLTTVADWGIYVNRGSFSFIDNTGFFNNETINTVDILGYVVKFYLAHKGLETLIGTFNIASASMNNETREISIECISPIGDLQKAKDTNGKSSYNGASAETLLDFMSESIIDSFSHMRKGADVNGLENTFIHAPFLPYGETFWTHLNKICQATMSRVFDDKDGNPIISGSFPIKNPIIVNPNNILDVISNDFTKATNCSIAVTNMGKKDDRLIDARQVFSISRDPDTNEVISISNCEYTLDNKGEHNVYASISKSVETPYIIIAPQMLHIYEQHSGDAYESGAKSTFGRQNLGYGSAITLLTGKQIGFNYTVRIDDYYINPVSGKTVYTYATNIFVDFEGQHFINHGTETKGTSIVGDKYSFEIQSNELIQTNSYFVEPGGETISLGDYLLREVERRYGNGIECFEIECLFNDYFNEQGEIVFDKDNLTQHFEKYDVIIPYVMKQGKTVPLRKNADGTPKKFRIIGISYSYDGLLRQRLQVQEDRYDID